MRTGSNLESFIRPRSIVVVGASERLDAWGHWLFWKLLNEGFPGTVYPIDRRAQTILGQPAYPTVRAVLGSADLAIIAIPAAQVLETIRDCAAKGVKAGLIITAGFSETRHDGRDQEQEMVVYARAHGMRLVGPNISGLINLHYSLLAHPAERQYLYKTPVTFICQGAYAMRVCMREKVAALCLPSPWPAIPWQSRICHLTLWCEPERAITRLLAGTPCVVTEVTDPCAIAAKPCSLSKRVRRLALAIDRHHCPCP